MARKKRVAIDRAQARRAFLALRPLRNPIIEWQEVENGVLLVLPLANNWKVRLLNVLMPLSDEERQKRVALDVIAAFVWLRCDGQTPIGSIARDLRHEYKLGEREAELSLQKFLQTLGKRGFVGFAQDVPAQDVPADARHDAESPAPVPEAGD